MSLMAALWTGCSAGSEETPTAGATSPQSASPETETPDTPSAAPTSASSLEPLRATPTTRPNGVVSAVLRASDGTNIVVFGYNGRGERTSYRLYDRRWRPRTPLLGVDTLLELQRGTAEGFVGRATNSNREGKLTRNEWITIDRAGGLHQVAHQPDRATSAQRRGDLFLKGDYLAKFAYRPATDTVLRRPRLAWDSLAHIWYVQGNGLICAMQPSPVSTGLVHVSVDDAHTFTHLPVSDAIPAGSGPRLQECHATRGGVILVTGGEYLNWLHTLDRAGQVVSSQRLGGQLDPYNWDTLPDGRLVAGTNQMGLMVAIDATNQHMEYRPGPKPMNAPFDILGGQILVFRSHHVDVSNDAGLTWRSIDLLPQ